MNKFEQVSSDGHQMSLAGLGLEARGLMSGGGHVHWRAVIKTGEAILWFIEELIYIDLFVFQWRHVGLRSLYTGSGTDPERAGLAGRGELPARFKAKGRRGSHEQRTASLRKDSTRTVRTRIQRTFPRTCVEISKLSHVLIAVIFKASWII